MLWLSIVSPCLLSARRGRCSCSFAGNGRSDKSAAGVKHKLSGKHRLLQGKTYLGADTGQNTSAFDLSVGWQPSARGLLRDHPVQHKRTPDAGAWRAFGPRICHAFSPWRAFEYFHVPDDHLLHSFVLHGEKEKYSTGSGYQSLCTSCPRAGSACWAVYT